MRRAITVLVALLLGTSIGTIAAPSVTPVDASGCVYIYRIYFDSPGADTGSNTSLNAEWIALKNKCSTGKALGSWTIRDASGHIYKFGTFTLKAGYIVKIHTGSGTNSTTHRYWGSKYYIWNNSGDKAILKNSAGTTVDSCSFTGAGDYTNC